MKCLLIFIYTTHSKCFTKLFACYCMALTSIILLPPETPFTQMAWLAIEKGQLTLFKLPQSGTLHLAFDPGRHDLQGWMSQTLLSSCLLFSPPHQYSKRPKQLRTHTRTHIHDQSFFVRVLRGELVQSECMKGELGSMQSL